MDKPLVEYLIHGLKETGHQCSLPGCGSPNFSNYRGSSLYCHRHTHYHDGHRPCDRAGLASECPLSGAELSALCWDCGAPYGSDPAHRRHQPRCYLCVSRSVVAITLLNIPVQPWSASSHGAYLGARRPLVRVLLLAMTRGDVPAARTLARHSGLFEALVLYVLAGDPRHNAADQWIL